MLGLQGTKGRLENGADADLVVFSERVNSQGNTELVIDEVWKFGAKVFSR
jgi:N-acetylglucosamine-6-phosphate deacetylase